MLHHRFTADRFQVINLADVPALGLGVKAGTLFVVLRAFPFGLVFCRNANPETDHFALFLDDVLAHTGPPLHKQTRRHHDVERSGRTVVISNSISLLVNDISRTQITMRSSVKCKFPCKHAYFIAKTRHELAVDASQTCIDSGGQFGDACKHFTVPCLVFGVRHKAQPA